MPEAEPGSRIIIYPWTRRTPAEELQPRSDIAQCILGNGVCPPSCQLHGLALESTREYGTDFMRDESREMVFSANPPQVTIILSMCEKESYEG